MGLFKMIVRFLMGQKAFHQIPMCPTSPSPLYPAESWCRSDEQKYTRTDDQFIRNGDRKICKNCIHYIESDYDGMPLSRCRKFGTMNVVDGEIFNNYADICRSNEDLCGISALWYEEHKNDTGNGTNSQTKRSFTNDDMHKVAKLIVDY